MCFSRLTVTSWRPSFKECWTLSITLLLRTLDSQLLPCECYTIQRYCHALLVSLTFAVTYTADAHASILITILVQSTVSTGNRSMHSQNDLQTSMLPLPTLDSQSLLSLLLTHKCGSYIHCNGPGIDQRTLLLCKYKK